MITVLGDGAFGTALAQILASNGHDITMWCYNPHIARSIEQKRCNERYLPAIELHRNIRTCTSLSETLSSPSWIVEAIPVAYLPEVVSSITSLDKTIPWVLASKGLKDTQLSSDIVTSRLGDVPLVILSGPSFARELAQAEPTGLTLAGGTHAQEFKKLLQSNTVTIDTTSDIIGTQLCGALKNVIALTMGIIEGAGYGANTQALLFTTMVQELRAIIEDKGGSPATLLQLAGIGDLTLTAYSSQSRNKTVGKALGRGDYRTKELPYTEGLNTLRSLNFYLGKNYGVVSLVSTVVFDNGSPELLVQACIKK